MEVHPGLGICPKRMIRRRMALPDLTVTGASALNKTAVHLAVLFMCLWHTMPYSPVPSDQLVGKQAPVRLLQVRQRNNRCLHMESVLAPKQNENTVPTHNCHMETLLLARMYVTYCHIPAFATRPVNQVSISLAECFPNPSTVHSEALPLI